MKKLLFVLIAVFAIAAPIFAADVIYQGPLVNETGIAYSKDYDLDMNSQHIDAMSVQAVYSSATIAAATFYDGTKSTATITVSSGTACAKSRLIIGGYALTEGIDWFVDNTSSQTASNLNTAIMKNPFMTAIVVSTIAEGGTVIYSTSTAVGTASNYILSSSTPSALAVSGATFLAGTNSGINYTLDTITMPASADHNFTTALPVLFTVTSGSAPIPLSGNTTYYAIPTADNYAFKLSTSVVNAKAGIAVDLKAVPAAGASTFKATPIPLTGNATFYFMYSNDGSNYIQHPTASSGTVSTATTANTQFGFDFGNINWRYIRLRYLGPTWGAIKLVITGNGKRQP